MKVFAPKRVIKIGQYTELGSSRPCGYGIPLDGEWVDVDDYFRQITRGGAINDVIHAKVVASTEVPYSCGDLTVGNRIYPCSSRGGGNVYFYDSIAMYIEHEVEELYYPDYKGKKPIQPRRRKRKVRTTHGASAVISINTSNSCPTLSVTLYVYNPVNDKHDPRLNARYAVKSFKLSISYTGSGLNKHIKCSADSYLYPVMDMMVGYFESRFGKRGEDYHGPIEDHRLPIHSACVSAITGNCYGLCELATHTAFGNVRYYSAYNVDAVGTDSVSGLRACFLLNEPETLAEGFDPIMQGRDGSLKSYWRNYLTQHALMEALESFPKLSDNTIANALEVIGFIKALVVDHRIEIPKSLADAWLSYRYQYTTTKLDVEEAVKFVRRHANLGTLEQGISCYGTSSHTFENGTTVTCRCECLVIPQIVNTAKRLLRTLDTYGLNPDFYVLWDMTPFSFMVDWFVPVGDMLGVEDANAKFLSGEFYKIMWICYSLSYTREFQNAHVKCYSRWKGSIPSSLNSFYWLEPPSSSSKTTVFRVLDAASIFIGR